MSGFRPSSFECHLLAVVTVAWLGLAAGGSALAVNSVVAWGANESGQINLPPSLTNIIAIDADGPHSLALRADGTVVAWGNNQFGQTNVPQNLSAVAIAAGGYHSTAVRGDGTVVAWGANDYGQTMVPQGLSNVVALAGGGWHSLALRADRTVIGWGWNGYGQIAIPAVLSNVVAIAAGGWHSLALRADGTVVAWGYNGDGQTTVPTGLADVVAIAAGSFHSLALRADGTVIGWGRSQEGQLAIPSNLTNVVAIAVGSYHSVALREDGTIFAWGSNSAGQTNIPSGRIQNAVAITCGGLHNVALIGNGTPTITVQPVSRTVYRGTTLTLNVMAAGSPPLAYQWQFNGVDVTGATNASLLLRDAQLASAGNYRVMVSNASGANNSQAATLTVVDLPLAVITTQPASQTVNEWQSASFSVLATGFPLYYQWRKDGVDIPGATNATYALPFASINQAGTYTVVVSNPAGSVTSAPPAALTVNAAPSGTVVAWGLNDEGQTNVPAGARNGVTAIAAGDSHTVALKSDGSVVAWGSNRDPDGHVTGQTNVPVAAQSGVVAVAAGGWHTVALKNDGSVVAWGAGTNNTRISPNFGQSLVPVAAQSGVTAIAASYDHTVALKSDGSVVAWGLNNFGQTTVPVAAQSGVIAIAAGTGFTVALKNDGTVVAWGDNSRGQTNVPVAAQGGVTAIAAGYYHTVALKRDGSVVAWGFTINGQTTAPVAAQSGVVAIAAGGVLSVALKNDGTVVAWGYNYAGITTTVPVAVQGRVTAIAAGYGHTVALLGDGTPALTVQPVNRTVIEGDTLEFAAMAVSPTPPTYQWQFNGMNIVGSTNQILDFVNVQPEDSGGYRVIVSNALGAVTSRVARLTVLLRPRLGSLPESTLVAVGAEVTLTANATGTPPLRYQWRKNGENIPGATNATYTLTNAQISDGGSYSVVVANDVGTVTSSPILVIVEVPQQPPGDNFADRVLITGATNSVGSTNRWATREVGEPYHAGKFGSNSVWYRWVAPSNGIATFRTVGSTFDTLLGVYTGTNVASLTPVAEDEDRGGFFTSQLRFNAQTNVEYAIAIDGFVGGQGTFILSWELEPTDQSLPVVTARPHSQTVRAGSSVTLSVEATGAGLTYQWHFNGARIAGANTTTLTVNNVQPQDVGFYTVAITNSVGRGIESLPAAVEIGPFPGVQGQDKLEDLFSELRPPAAPGAPFAAASFITAFISVAAGTVDYQITSTRDATSQSWEPNHCGSIGGASKWFEFHAETNATIVIDTQGSTFDTVLAVYRKVGVFYLAQNELDCNTDWHAGEGWSRVSFEAQRGSNYWVVVDGAKPTDLTGRAQLNWAMGRLPRIEVAPEYDLIHVGQTRRFWAGVTNAIPPARYRWLHNGQPIPGATSEWLDLPALGLTNAGSYSVVASNALGEVQQLIAQLTAPMLTSELKPAEGKYKLTLAPVEFPGLTMVLESSTDLIHWIPVTTHTNALAPVSLDFPLNQPQRFFRTRPGR